MANTSIKITQLPNIGNNLGSNSLLPVVNTTGTAITDKVTVGNVANYILTQAGNTLPEAFVAQIAYSVANAAQPNITSVGTLSVNTLKITGGNNGYVLQTDGLGNLSWTAQTGGGGNASPGGANTQVQFNDAGLFGGSADLTWSDGNLNTSGIVAGNVYSDNYYYSNGAPFGGGGANTGDIGFVGNAAYNLGGVIIENADLTHGATSALLIPENGNTTAPLQLVNTYGNVLITTGTNPNSTYTWTFTKTGNLSSTGNLSVGRITGDGGGISNINSANIVGEVAYANIANAVAVANVIGLGNIATIGLDGNSSNVLYGNGVFSGSGNLNAGNLRLTGNANITSTIPSINQNTGALKVAGGLGVRGNIHSGDEIHSAGNVVVGGDTLFVGASADATGLTNPTLVIFHSGDEFIQAALKNSLSTGSADWVAYGDNGTDGSGWADMGFTSSEFNDPNYTITSPGDGYFFVQSFAGSYGGNLVLSTGDLGIVNDIVFSTGGFLLENEFARIENTNNTLHLTRTGSSITFADGTVQTTAYTGGGGGNTGNITFSNTTIGTSVTDQTINIATSTTAGDDTQVQLLNKSVNIYTLDTGANSFAQLVINDNDNTAPNVSINLRAEGNNNSWVFDSNGTLNLPGYGVIKSPSVNIVSDNYSQLQWVDSGNINIPDPNSTGGPTNWLYVDSSGAYIETNINNGNLSSTWSFDTYGEINLPANSFSFGTGRIQSANGYPTLLAYGSGGHGGPELDWMNSDNPNDYENGNVLRNTLYLNDEGLYVGMNESHVAGTYSGSWRFDPSGEFYLPSIPTGDNTSEQVAYKGQRKTILSNHWSAFVDGTTPTPTVVYTATNSSIMSIKTTIFVQHAGQGYEMFDVSALKSNTYDVNYSVSNRLNNTGGADTQVSVDLDGSGTLQITLTVVSGSYNNYVTYDVTEFGLPND